MNTLIAVGTGAAFLYSVLATVAPGFFLSRGVQPDVYYEAVVIIIALILAGNALEARAKSRTSAALRGLVALQPKTARVLRGNSGSKRKSTCPSRTCAAATRWSSARASGCRSTARSSRERARWTSRCSPASPCRSRRHRATG